MSMPVARIEEIVLDAIRSANRARTPDKQLPVSSRAVIFGAGSPLDSLGLVALLIDIEEAFAAESVDLILSDERAVSLRHSPFQTVTTLVEYIQTDLDRRA